MNRSGLIVGMLVGVALIIPVEGYPYREDESEQAIDADIDRGEDALVRRVIGAGEDVVKDTEQAMKAETKRDIQFLRKGEEVKPQPTKDDDSIAEIEREVDALTPQ